MVKKLIKMKNYLIVYLVNILTSCIILSFFDRNMHFLFPFIITVTTMYIPIVFLNYLFRSFNILTKNLIYIFLGLTLYIGLLSIINGAFSFKYLFISDASGFITVYSFMIFMLLHTLIFYFFKDR